MASADAARLRFVMSADAGGLKAGCKEAAGSLKELDSGTRQQRQGFDNWSPDWKGLKKSSRGLKFIGREMGGMLKGGIGDLAGIAGAGAALGPMGAAMAAGAVGVNMYQQHQEALEKDRTKAYQDFRAASNVASEMPGGKKGLDISSYRQVSAIAGEDTKFLDELAIGMKRVEDAGPNASAALKKFAENVSGLGHMLGVDKDTSADVERKQGALSAEKTLENAGQSKDAFGYHDLGLVEKHLKEKFQKENPALSEKDAAAKAAEKMNVFSKHDLFGMGSRKVGVGLSDDERTAYEETMSGFDKDVRAKQREAAEQAELLGKGATESKGLKTNKEKLDDRLSEIEKIKKASGYGSTDEENNRVAARATEEALGEYKRSQGGGAVEMAGAATAGSTEAYSVIARAQMGAGGAENDTATTNALLEKHLPDLIDAVKSLNPNWRRADGPA